jgi:hypothetical protein
MKQSSLAYLMHGLTLQIISLRHKYRLKNDSVSIYSIPDLHNF